MDIDLLKLVKTDLEYICKEWNATIDDDSLRRNSTVLRMLLVDGNLLRAWKQVAFDKEPMIITPTLNSQLLALYSEGVTNDHIIFAQAGGAKILEGSISGMMHVDINLSEQQEEIIHRGGESIEILSLSKFLLRSSCMYVLGMGINRQELIQYVSNKLGGAHYDPKRNYTDEKERKFAALDQVRESIQTLDKNSIYYELLAVGQSLCKSNDIHRLITRLEEIIV